ncbi:GAF domain-containing protein [Mucilaginibacter gracilis]|uniref:histidine kinase n=1 Tax=Mucilaginibacter gracilis TaxID=423350 RepID=A0A495J8I7_9SPHI|nr:GAF domain-containing protein [Mucilaginibacter gracilis]RKR85306.1 GAF domain-containing protein [Mucilaginibacter gracilis]
MPQKELERLQAVNRFLNLSIDKDQNLQEIVELASELCETPVALISLIDDDTYFLNFKVGTEINKTLRQDSFCQYLTNKNELLIVPDATLDSRFANSPHVTGNPHIRFYAGIALTTHDGHNLGSLCVIDPQPRPQLTRPQQHLLQIMGKRIVQIMEFEFSLQILKEQYLEAKDTEIKLRSFFESGTSCHLLLGKQLDVITYNKNMANFIRRIYNIDLQPGTMVNQILSGPALQRFEEECNIALDGMPIHQEREVKYPSENIWWDITFEPCYDAEGETIGVSFNANDITERKLHEQQIVAKNESLKNIAHIQSHDLRRPVASILGFMEIFKSSGYQSTKEELMMMESATKELDDKIRDIVTFTE